MIMTTRDLVLQKSTHAKLLQFGWTTIPHPPHSPALTSMDNHLFRSLSNYIHEKKFNDEDDVKMGLAISSVKSLRTCTSAESYPLAERLGSVIKSSDAYTTEN